MIPVLCLLALAVIIPSACVLWFMTQAVKNEQLAVRQRLTQVYQDEFQKFREELNEHWEKTLSNLGSAKKNEKTGERFMRAVHDDNVSGSSVIIFDNKGNILYPKLLLDSPPPLINLPPQWYEAEELEYVKHDLNQAAEKYAQIAQNKEYQDVWNIKKVNLGGRAWQGQIRCLIQMGKENEALDAFMREGFIRYDYIAAMDADGRLIQPNLTLLINNYSTKLLQDLQHLTKEKQRYLKGVRWKLYHFINDYSYFPLIPAPQRRFLMHQLVDQDIGEKKYLYYMEQEDLAAEFLESKTEFTTRTKLSKTKVPNVWQVRTSNGEVLILYTTQKLKEIIQYFTYPTKLSLQRSGFSIEAKPIDESWQKKPFMELSAGQAMPDWSLGLFFKGADPFILAEKQQRTIYLWTGLLGVAAMAILVGLIGRYQMRQMKLTQLKNDFVATVTHELKTPLASMRLLTDTLLEGRYRDESQVRDYLELIIRENHRLSRLIDNFLTFSRMERNKRIFDFKRVRPDDIVTTALDSIREKITAEGFELKVNVEPNLPEITGDRDSLVTVLINLLDNACKYSEHEKWISLHVFAANDSLFFEVTDRGIGMSRREMKHLFERFYQVDQHLSRKVGGCGLGLSIVKFIIDAHGGTIDVTSEKSLGSRFRIKIPIDSDNTFKSTEDL